uniref:Olfactory receptor n=1 Tax=Leptobrachium leishanense TaxID=445787 RepID=A0A8C5M149_9ANUR
KDTLRFLSFSKSNGTFRVVENFLLIGIPGLEEAHIWISIPLSVMFVFTLFINTVMLYVILSKESFHKPMYLFLCMMSIVDLVVSCTAAPKILCIFWFKALDIGFTECLVQLYFIHAFSMMESTVLMVMAFDRYFAICHPLRYTVILTNQTITTIGVLTVLRGSFLMAPCPFLIKRLSYCQTNVIANTYCEHMSVVKISCSDTTINQIYGLTVALLVSAVDIFSISFSYCVIVRAVLRLSSNEARRKALSTCGSHLIVILITYFPALFSFFSHRFGHIIPIHIHVIFANLYLLIPPTCNPLIYGVKTKEIRERIIFIFFKKN